MSDDVMKDVVVELETLYLHLAITSRTDDEKQWWGLKQLSMEYFPQQVHLVDEEGIRAVRENIGAEIDFLKKTYAEQLGLVRSEGFDELVQAYQVWKAAEHELKKRRLSLEVDDAVYDVMKDTGADLKAVCTHLEVTSRTDEEEQWWGIKGLVIFKFPYNVRFTDNESIRAIGRIMSAEIDFLKKTYAEQLEIIRSGALSEFVREKEARRKERGVQFFNPLA